VSRGPLGDRPLGGQLPGLRRCRHVVVVARVELTSPLPVVDVFPRGFSDIPNLGSCTQGVTRSGKTRPCHESLSRVPAVHLDPSPAVVIQRELLCVLRAGHASDGIYASSPVPSTMYTRDLRTLGEWMLRYGQAHDVATRISNLLWEQLALRATKKVVQPIITSGGARMTCSSAVADAAIACLAMPVLQAPDTETAARRLQWLTSSMRRRGLSPSAPRNVWRRGNSPPLDGLRQTVLSAHDFFRLGGKTFHLRRRAFVSRPRFVR
jgi:hypothetical protein